MLQIRTHTGGRVVIILSCIARAGPACQRPLAAGGTSQTVARRGLTSRASVRAGWKVLVKYNYKIFTCTDCKVIVILPCVAGTGSTRQRPLTASRTGQTVTRRGLASRAGLGAGWGILKICKCKFLLTQVATLLSK